MTTRTEIIASNEQCQQVYNHLGQGAETGITGKKLAILTGLHIRTCRKAIEQMRLIGEPICGTPGTGYFIAATPEELHTTCNHLSNRAYKSLMQVSRMNNIGLLDLVGQLQINFQTGEQNA